MKPKSLPIWLWKVTLGNEDATPNYDDSLFVLAHNPVQAAVTANQWNEATSSKDERKPIIVMIEAFAPFVLADPSLINLVTE